MAKNKFQDEAAPGDGVPAVAAVAVAPAAEAVAVPAVGTPEFNSLTCAERTQIIATQRYQGAKQWFCTLRDMPPITLAADSPADAEARYKELCGIRFTEHQIGIQPV